MGKVRTTGSSLTPQEYVALFGQFNGPDQATILDAIKRQWFEGAWKSLDGQLPDDPLADDEIIDELRALRNGQ